MTRKDAETAALYALVLALVILACWTFGPWAVLSVILNIIGGLFVLAIVFAFVFVLTGGR